MYTDVFSHFKVEQYCYGCEPCVIVVNDDTTTPKKVLREMSALIEAALHNAYSPEHGGSLRTINEVEEHLQSYVGKTMPQPYAYNVRVLSEEEFNSL